jgi:HK97 family phage prohead protease
MKNLEYKYITGAVEDIDTTKRVVTGYLSRFGNTDLDKDIMDKGAFDKTLSERKNQIYFLNQHNWSQPHGKFAVLEVDEYGLKFESNQLPDTTYSNDALKLYEAGIVKEHSVGFLTLKSEYNRDTDLRVIKEVKLYEGSNVTLGANPDAIFTGLKSFTKEDISDREKAILKAFRNGTFTDETFSLLEIALKQLQLQSYELGKQEALAEPLQDTQIKAAEKSQETINYLKTFKL